MNALFGHNFLSDLILLYYEGKTQGAFHQERLIGLSICISNHTPYFDLKVVSPHPFPNFTGNFAKLLLQLSMDDQSYSTNLCKTITYPCSKLEAVKEASGNLSSVLLVHDFVFITCPKTIRKWLSKALINSIKCRYSIHYWHLPNNNFGRSVIILSGK